MLVIDRKAQQSTILTCECCGESIEVKILKMKGDRVKIGIGASPSVRVMREEIADKPAAT